MSIAVHANAAQLRSRGRSAQRAAPALRGYWRGSWIASVLALSFIMIRAGEVLGPIRQLKPVFTVTVLLLLFHLFGTGAVAWKSIRTNVTFQLAVAMGVCICLSVPFSIWKGQSVSTMMTLPWSLSLVALLSLNAPSLRNFDRVLMLATWVAALTAIALVSQGAVVEGSRLTSLGTYDPNDLGALFVIMIPFALGASTRGPKLSRLISAVSAAVLFAVLMKTGSRGGLIGLVVGLSVFSFSYRPRKILMILGAIIILAPLTWPLLPTVTKERAVTLFSLDEDYNTTSNSGRLYLWKRGVVFALANPLVGLGAGTFEVQIGEDFRDQGTRGAWHTAHNTYVQIFAELGMPGGILLLALIGRSARNAAAFWSWRTTVHRPELLASLAAYLSAIVFLSHGYSYILWGMFGIAAMTEQLLRTRPTRTSVISGPTGATRLV
ncbi:O-antigen ligase family protein [Gemmatimonas groenlandica]|uniref:O-antigen ligase family protein n=1 Tax=Gemmatimonas groenlandica TaxID=2732249 RepID=A0A6M4IVK8_9BACT|nr:O-antigen ligase family protein [Gemmatimonas groenlandica]QJR36221.1 O-antigen ligase family protein [Gemmatimonas groenlandica]